MTLALSACASTDRHYGRDAAREAALAPASEPSLAPALVSPLESTLASASEIGQAQRASSPAIEAMLSDLYESFCFDAGGEADWASMRGHFAEDASFVSIRKGVASATGADTFIADFRRWINTSQEGRTGLHERIVRTRIDSYGDIGHAYVTFEGFVPGSEEAQTLGLDSIQLVRDRGEWKLSSFASQFSNEQLPMPTRFLPASVVSAPTD